MEVNGKNQKFKDWVIGFYNIQDQ